MICIERQTIDRLMYRPLAKDALMVFVRRRRRVFDRRCELAGRQAGRQAGDLFTDPSMGSGSIPSCTRGDWHLLRSGWLRTILAPGDHRWGSMEPCDALE